MTAWPFLALLGPRTAIQEAQRHLLNVEAADRVCQETGMPFYLMCAFLEKEGWPIGDKVGGHNIYGHDIGGVFRVPPPGVKYVTQANYADFYRRVVINRETSNGVGPLQITYWGFHKEMHDQGLKGWIPHDSMLYGARVLMTYLNRSSDVRWVGTWYNAGPGRTTLVQPYADLIAQLAAKWKARVGS